MAVGRHQAGPGSLSSAPHRPPWRESEAWGREYSDKSDRGQQEARPSDSLFRPTGASMTPPRSLPPVQCPGGHREEEGAVWGQSTGGGAGRLAPGLSFSQRTQLGPSTGQSDITLRVWADSAFVPGVPHSTPVNQRHPIASTSSQAPDSFGMTRLPIQFSKQSLPRTVSFTAASS